MNGAGVTTRTVYAPVTDRLQQILVGRNGGVEVQDHTYAFNALGRLESFTDGQALLNEVYGYDGLNRLRTVTRTGAVAGTDSVAYDALGNITFKSGVGTYAYNPSGANSVRPHAVASIAGTVYGMANPSFTYDAAGNLTAGLGRSFEYTSFNLPSRITQGALVADFTYDADYGRIKQVAGGVTTVYLNPRIDAGGTYTKEINGATTTHRWIVYAGGRPVLEMQRTDSGATQTWQPRGYHVNHLGSLVALTDESGAVKERLSYDAWGKRRNLDGTADPNAPPNGIKSTTTPRGFTLHEHLEGLGLIHMNGRIFDPLLARFMTADPLLNDPANLQSHNRYAYVLNSPFMYTDPSGFKPFWKQKWFRTVAAVAAVAVVGPWVAEEVMWSLAATNAEAAAIGNLAGAAVGGGLAGGVQSGSIEGVLNGVAFGVITSGIGAIPSDLGRLAGHAAVGCAYAAAGGADCGAGATSAAFTFLAAAAMPDAIAANRAYGYAYIAASGCLGARIGGGKCSEGSWNAALSAAMQYAYNHEWHSIGQNAARGKAAEALTIEAAEAAGYRVERGVMLRIAANGEIIDAIADYAYRVGDRIVFGEVKDGVGAKFSANQKAVYEALSKGNAWIVSEAKAAALGLRAGEAIGLNRALTITAAEGGRALAQAGRFLGVRASGAFSLLIRGAASGTAVGVILDFVLNVPEAY